MALLQGKGFRLISSLSGVDALDLSEELGVPMEQAVGILRSVRRDAVPVVSIPSARVKNPYSLFQPNLDVDVTSPPSACCLGRC